ncbi:short chain dehydrogenase reductase family [Fusarium albosuccineum]|uniref:Short chain dehydrogenase reductase family n=1 Tax=Fusarium albosuccineum TaxID=1237068 RepID=A0A8H4LIV4_9HYPO|nr:short chain dehydrogenase reductase family [Fusarium albosuccineum]
MSTNGHQTNGHARMIDPNEKKKIILCFDGTGNTFQGKNEDTNVVKILQKLDRNHPNQYHYYQTGIGTYDINETSVNKTPIGDIKSNILQTLDSGFGNTFDAHVIAGYRFLMRYYETDAKIYIFGFSRGAFTAKFLARMINKVGLLCKGNEEMVPFAYRLYQRYLQGEVTDRKAAQCKANHPPSEDGGAEANGGANANGVPSDTGSQAALVSNADNAEEAEEEEEEDPAAKPAEEDLLASNTKIQPSDETLEALGEIESFSQTFCRKETNKNTNKEENIKVFFLGMWDCVASVAILEQKAPLPVAVTGTAHHVRHAVAVDERRVKFKAALLAQDIKNHIQKKQSHIHDSVEREDIKEVWFPGNHGDVGGGWPTKEIKSDKTDKKPPKKGKKNRKGRKGRRQEDREEEDFQMSDIPLEWMIREVDAVGKANEAAAVHWCCSKEKFETDMSGEKRVQAQKGMMHDCLSLFGGPTFIKVLFWNLMEYLPGISRWELKDQTQGKDKLQGWVPRRWTPNWGSYRDIPRGAVLHQSLVDRLRNFADYKPYNNHGDGSDHCLAKKEPIVIYDADDVSISEAERANRRETAKFRIHEKVVVTDETTITKNGREKFVTKRVPVKEDDPRHQTYDFNDYVRGIENKKADKDTKKNAAIRQ